MGNTRKEKPYSAVCDWFDSKPSARRELSPQQLSDYRRIKALPEPWGRQLDQLAGSYRLLRWVAGPGECYPHLREARYRDAKATLERGVLSNKAWKELQARHPAVTPRRGTSKVAALSASVAASFLAAPLPLRPPVRVAPAREELDEDEPLRAAAGWGSR